MSPLTQILLVSIIGVVAVNSLSLNADYDEAVKKVIKLLVHLKQTQVKVHALIGNEDALLGLRFRTKTGTAIDAANTQINFMYNEILEKTLTADEATGYLNEIMKISEELQLNLQPEFKELSTPQLRKEIGTVYAKADEKFESISNELLALL